jgi:hypothetical protein
MNIDSGFMRLDLKVKNEKDEFSQNISVREDKE